MEKYFLKQLSMCHASSVLSDRAKAQRRGQATYERRKQGKHIENCIYMRVWEYTC